MRLFQVLSLMLDLLAVTRALAPFRLPARWVNAAPFGAGLFIVLHVGLEG